MAALPHSSCRACIEPSLQKNPAAQTDGTQAELSPATHSAAHASVCKPSIAPKRPAGHLRCVFVVDPAGHQWPRWHGPLQLSVLCAADIVWAALPGLAMGAPYLPAGHLFCVDEVDPASHQCPGSHKPLQAVVVSPAAAGSVVARVPSARVTTTCAELSPCASPYVPAGQSRRRPPTQYDPGSQRCCATYR